MPAAAAQGVPGAPVPWALQCPPRSQETTPCSKPADTQDRNYGRYKLVTITAFSANIIPFY